MVDFLTLDTDTLRHMQKQLTLKYEEFKQQNLKLNMSRGKPCPEQLDLSAGLLEGLNRNYLAADGTDCRNYGGLEGLPEARRLLPSYWKSNRMRLLSTATQFGVDARSDRPGLTFRRGWAKRTPGQQPIKFLCPSRVMTGILPSASF